MVYIVIRVGGDMADWLFEKDNYVPKEDKINFIDKSIVSFIRIISLIKRKTGVNCGVLQSLNPVLKLAFTMLIIILMSLSRSFAFVWSINVYYLLLLSTLNGEEIKDILKISIIVPLFTLIILIPAMIIGSKTNSILIISKVIGTVLSINILSYTTRWTYLMKALKLFHIPDVFILIFDITIRYIYILGEFSLELLYALKLRSVGRNDKKYTSIAGIMGSLFLKSKDMSEEMYSAMECRGFQGEYTSIVKFKFSFKDFIYCLINVIAAMLFFFL